MGFFLPPLGIILALVVAIVMFHILNPGRSMAPKPGKENEFIFKVMMVAGTILVMMVLMLPVSNDGLYQSSFRNPSTYVKYLSVLFLEPGNLLSTDLAVRSPGLPIIVTPALVLIALGGILPSSILKRRMKVFVMLAGMSVLTMAPVISHFAVGATGGILYDYNLFFFLGWAGMTMMLVSEFIPDKIGPQGAAAMMMFLPLVVTLPHIDIAHLTAQIGAVAKDFESDHHAIAGLLGGLFGGLGGTNSEEELEPETHILELTYPAGHSEYIFTTGWLFGARCIANAGTEDEMDLSDQVQWSGSGTFTPNVGSRSRPSFHGPGFNQIVLTVNINKKLVTKQYSFQAVSNSLHAAVGDQAHVPADAHGCPACPHPCIGPITSGSSTVLINGKPAARVGDVGVHSACCGPNSFTITGSSSRVRIDGRPAVKQGDTTQHCGGTGKIVSGAP